MNKILNTLLIAGLAWSVTMCDQKTGESPDTIIYQPVRSIQISPGSAEFTEAMGAKDTTVSLSVLIEINHDDLMDSYPVASAKTTDIENSPEPSPEITAEVVIRSGLSNEVYDRFEITDYDTENQQFSTTYDFETRTIAQNDFRFYARLIYPEAQQKPPHATFKVRGFSAGQPEILSVQHPDTVFIPDEGQTTFQLFADVGHQFDLSLIESAFFDLYDRDGNRLGNSSFEMERVQITDSAHRFGAQLPIASTNQQDSIRVEFFAFDVFETSSDTLISNFIIH